MQKTESTMANKVGRGSLKKGDAVLVRMDNGAMAAAMVVESAKRGCFVKFAGGRRKLARWSDLYEIDSAVGVAKKPRPPAIVTPLADKLSNLRLVQKAEAEKEAPPQSPAPISEATPKPEDDGSAESLSEYLTRWRMEHGVTQRVLAKAAGLSHARRCSEIECQRYLATDDEVLGFASALAMADKEHSRSEDWWLEKLLEMRRRDAAAGARKRTDYLSQARRTKKQAKDQEAVFQPLAPSRPKARVASMPEVAASTESPGKITVVVNGIEVTATPAEIRALLGA